jgi:hypothetical protein
VTGAVSRAGRRGQGRRRRGCVNEADEIIEDLARRAALTPAARAAGEGAVRQHPGGAGKPPAAFS